MQSHVVRWLQTRWSPDVGRDGAGTPERLVRSLSQTLLSYLRSGDFTQLSDSLGQRRPGALSITCQILIH